MLNYSIKNLRNRTFQFQTINVRYWSSGRKLISDIWKNNLAI